MCGTATYVYQAEDSKALNKGKGPMILIADSGMMTGGHIFHHLKTFGPDPRSALLLVGHQADGTRVQAINQGAEAVKVHGEYVPISIESAPRRVFITHGDPPASEAFRLHLHEKLGWEPTIPRDGESVELA